MKKIAYYNLLSEKSVDLAGLSKYVLLVDRDINKTEIKKEIKKEFKVDILKINAANYLGKLKGMGKKKGKKPDFKKIIITLKKGQKIREFELEEKESAKKDKVKK